MQYTDQWPLTLKENFTKGKHDDLYKYFCLNTCFFMCAQFSTPACPFDKLHMHHIKGQLQLTM